MTIDTIVQIVLTIAVAVLIPCLWRLADATNRNTEAVARLEANIAKGVEPRLAQCEDDIKTLNDCTTKHGNILAALKATHPGLSQ